MGQPIGSVADNRTPVITPTNGQIRLTSPILSGIFLHFDSLHAGYGAR